MVGEVFLESLRLAAARWFSGILKSRIQRDEIDMAQGRAIHMKGCQPGAQFLGLTKVVVNPIDQSPFE